MDKNLLLHKHDEKYLASPYNVFSLSKSRKWIIRNLDSMEEEEYSVGDILKKCEEAKSYSVLADEFGKTQIDNLISKRFLVCDVEKWRLHSVLNAEIETTTICNNRCVYCPVRYNPKDSKVMSMELFGYIIDKIGQYGKIEYVTFNSYNEPCIDPYFIQRAEIVSKTNMKMLLNTNGTRLDKKMIERLFEMKVLDRITFNLPTIDCAEYERLTSNKGLTNVLEAIDYCINLGLNVHISVQGTKEELKKNLRQINDRFSYHFHNSIKGSNTVDRGGTLSNQYSQNIDIEGKLYGGCHKLTQWINISVDGDFFICCNDYYQKSTYASIFDGSLEQIINSEKAILNRKYIFGDCDAPKDYLCRHCDLMKTAEYMYDKGMHNQIKRAQVIKK